MTPLTETAPAHPTSMATLLERVMDRNPRLIHAAARLHREHRIPANSWVIDLDAIAANATVLAKTARAHGLRTYVMTKQYNRNPFVTSVAIKRGLHKAVAVDIHCARSLHRFGIPIGHLGHLNQIPRRELDVALRMRPEVVTVFSFDAAAALSEAAHRLGIEQDVLVRPVGPNDVFFPGQEGGIPEEELESFIEKALRLPNIRIAGVTSFPCVRYNLGEADRSEPQVNPNVATLRRAAGLFRDRFGLEIDQINTPGNTASETMPLLAREGATHVEPGHGLLGTTPNHIYSGDQAEIPTYVYVSEVSHHVGDQAYGFAGGLCSLMSVLAAVEGAERQPALHALVGANPDALAMSTLTYQPIDQLIDYHVALAPGSQAEVGDTIVMAFYTQMQMTRSYVVPVSGVATGEIQHHGIFDMGNNLLDGDYEPVPVSAVRKNIDALLDRY